MYFSKVAKNQALANAGSYRHSATISHRRRNRVGARGALAPPNLKVGGRPPTFVQLVTCANIAVSDVD